jgi:branched-chain amino acid transport system substrate-binding protein
MKTRRLSMVSMLMLAMVIVLVVALVFGGCAKPAPATKTLKIGLISFLGSQPGLNIKQNVELQADNDNKNGGLAIGGDRYTVQIISYDSNNVQTTAVAAINRLVFEDKVKFIISDQVSFEPAWLSITDANKVLVAGIAMGQEDLSPNYHYSFNPTGMNTVGIAAAGWFCKNFPDKLENVVCVSPDNQMGHIGEQMQKAMWEKFGAKTTWIFYPPGTQDLSAVATKVRAVNPSTFSALAMDPVVDGLLYKAVWEAGWRGQTFSSSGEPVMLMATTCPMEALEGWLSSGWPQEFDPPATQAAKDYVAAWTAKYGKWEGQDGLTSLYACLKTALQKAGSLDTDKVGAVVYNGLKYEAYCGSFQMISRPDLGNNRTVDSVNATYIKQVKGGKVTLLATISIDEAINYFRMAHSP